MLKELAYPSEILPDFRRMPTALSLLDLLLGKAGQTEWLLEME
jgi:hypothetical protein